MDRLYISLDRLRTGLWPIPLAMAAAALVLYKVALAVDDLGIDEDFLRRWYLHSGSGDDARNLLSILLTAIITMSSVVFSITIVVLSNASNQFGTRLIRTYMADIRTKLTLGLLSMTIVYCLVALRDVQKDMAENLVPHVAVSTGWLLGLSCVLVLLFFLHFVSRSIVADQIIRRVTAELTEMIETMPTIEQAGEDDEQVMLDADFEERSAILHSRSEGYIELIRYDELLTIATQHRVQLRLESRAGGYMCAGGWLARVAPKDAVNEQLTTSILQQVLIGPRRTPTQDVEFMIRHLVDIALRALSPGINDENTCLVVIDHLSGALAQLAGRHIPSHRYRDDAGVLRVQGRANDYGGVLAAALNQIREAAGSHPAVTIEVIRALGRIGEHARLDAQRDALLEHARLFKDGGLRTCEEPFDRSAIERAFMVTKQKLQGLALPR